MSTHSTRRSHNNFIKKYKTRSGYDREKRAMKVLIDNDVKFVTQFIEYCDQSKEIYFEYVHNKGSLEQIISKCVLNVLLRNKYWDSIQKMLRKLHYLNISHGDFKCKNIIVKNDDTLLLCDFDLANINPNHENFLDDLTKLKFIYYQLFCVRKSDIHHWPYNNNNNNFRNGEQIYNEGPNLQKDLNDLCMKNILFQIGPSIEI